MRSGGHGKPESATRLGALRVRTIVARWVLASAAALAAMTLPFAVEPAEAASDAGRIVYQESVAGGTEIMTVDAAGGTPTSVAWAGPFGASGFPSLSPDGSTIVFSKAETRVDYDGRYVHANLYTVPFGGGALTELTHLDALEHPNQPTWSPDGSKLAYSHDTSQDLFVAPANGGSPTLVAQHSGGVSEPSWSPDGSTIIYTTLSEKVARNSQLEAIPAGGGARRVLAEGYWLAGSDWSPDSRRIVYSIQTPEGQQNGGSNDLYTIPAGGGTPKRLTYTPYFEELSPTWSPDGTKVAFEGYSTSSNSVDSEIYTLPVAGGARTQLTSNDANDQQPDWGVDYDAQAAQAAKFAPKVFLHPGEYSWPMSASAFVENSRLMWAHDSGCRNHTEASTGNVSERALGLVGSGPYRHSAASNLTCRHKGREYFPGEYTKPRPGDDSAGRVSTLAKTEGFYLDLERDFQIGTAPDAGDPPDVYDGTPVYYEVTQNVSGDETGTVAGDGAHTAITYWFSYGYSSPIDYDKFAHEGDWEHVNVHLSEDGTRPTQVDYFAHHAPADPVNFANVEKEGMHPVVYSALGAHGSYPAEGTKTWCHDTPCLDRMAQGRQWRTWEDVRSVKGQPWYGFGGAWGRVGTPLDTTGPLAPSPYKDPFGHG